jgi:hypothetical protein
MTFVRSPEDVMVSSYSSCAAFVVRSIDHVNVAAEYGVGESPWQFAGKSSQCLHIREKVFVHPAADGV